MINELNEVKQKIDEILNNESFPDTVKPSYLQEAVRSYPCRGGKRIRPALVLRCCGLLKGNVTKAEYAAASVEVYHKEN